MSDYLFTEHNLDTLADDDANKLPQSVGNGGVFNKFLGFENPRKEKPKILKNSSSKSLIFAPFNSSFDGYDEDNPGAFEWPSEVIELLQPKRSKIIKFDKRCRDLNRQYEANNNADLDNGVYNAFVNEQEQEAERRLLQNIEKQKKKDAKKLAGNNEEQKDDKVDSSSSDSLESCAPNTSMQQRRVTEADELSLHESMQKLHELNRVDQLHPVRKLDIIEQIDEMAISATLKVFMRTWTHAHKNLLCYAL